VIPLPHSTPPRRLWRLALNVYGVKPRCLRHTETNTRGAPPMPNFCIHPGVLKPMILSLFYHAIAEPVLSQLSATWPRTCCWLFSTFFIFIKWKVRKVKIGKKYVHRCSVAKRQNNSSSKNRIRVKVLTLPFVILTSIIMKTSSMRLSHYRASVWCNVNGERLKTAKKS